MRPGTAPFHFDALVKDEVEKGGRFIGYEDGLEQELKKWIKTKSVKHPNNH